MCMNPSVEYMRVHREEHQRKLELAREYARGYEDGKRAMSADEWYEWYRRMRSERDLESAIEKVLIDMSLGLCSMGKAVQRLKGLVDG